MNKSIEPSEPRLNPDPDVLDAGWWIGFYYNTLPEIICLAESGDVRNVRKALKLVRRAESEISADLGKGKNSYILRVFPDGHFDQVTDVFKLVRRSAMKLRSESEWQLLDAVEGKPAIN